MSENIKEFLLKLLYTVIGLLLSSAVSFLHANDAVFGTSTAVIVGILSVVEQVWFQTPESSDTIPPAAPTV